VATHIVVQYTNLLHDCNFRLHMIGLKLINRFWVLAISTSRLKIDPGMCPESDITLAGIRIDGGKPDFCSPIKFAFSIHSCRSCYATLHLCQLSFYCDKIFVKFRNSNKNVLKIVLIIVNINKDENESLISNQFSLKNDFSPISWRTILRK